MLNGKFSTWKNVSAGVPQCAILGHLLFLIYINDLTEGLSTNAKLFADDTSLFSVIHDIQTSANNLNKDLERISNWAKQWKMNFNPDTTKQAQEVIFSRKVKKTVHPPLLFNNATVTRTSSQKYLGIILDNQLKFDDHIKTVFTKISKTIGLLRKLHNFLPRAEFITIYKLSSDPILIIVISFMIKHIICLFTKNSDLFSITHAWSLLEPYEVHRKKSFTKK